MRELCPGVGYAACGGDDVVVGGAVKAGRLRRSYGIREKLRLARSGALLGRDGVTAEALAIVVNY
jgi:hypothetical protein